MRLAPRGVLRLGLSLGLGLGVGLGLGITLGLRVRLGLRLGPRPGIWLTFGLAQDHEYTRLCCAGTQCHVLDKVRVRVRGIVKVSVRDRAR